MKPKILSSVKSDPKIKAAARSTAEILLITAAAKAAISKCLDVTKVPRAPLPPMSGLTRFLITGDATFALKMNGQVLFALGEGLERFVGGGRKAEAPKEEPVKEQPITEEPVAEEVAEEPAEEPVAEEVAEEPAEEPVAEEVAEEPVEEPVTEEVAEEPAEEPVTEEVAEEPAEEPVAEEVAEEPVEEPVTEEVAEEPAEEPVTEEVVEEPVEEPVAEEVAEEPVEEPVTEEVVEEPAEEPVAEEVAEEPAEEPAVEVMAPVSAPASVAETSDEEGDDLGFGGETLEYIDVKDEPEAYAALLAQAEAGEVQLVTRYRRSYESRLIQSKDPMQDYYSGIKNALLSYKGVKSRVSWANEKFHQGRNHIAKIIVKTSSLYIYLAVDPATLAGTKYESAINDMSDKKKFETTPTLLKIKGERKYKYALELIETICRDNLQLPPNKKFVETDYKRPAQTDEELVESGTVRKLVAGVPIAPETV